MLTRSAFIQFVHAWFLLRARCIGTIFDQSREHYKSYYPYWNLHHAHIFGTHDTKAVAETNDHAPWCNYNIIIVCISGEYTPLHILRLCRHTFGEAIQCYCGIRYSGGWWHTKIKVNNIQFAPVVVFFVCGWWVLIILRILECDHMVYCSHSMCRLCRGAIVYWTDQCHLHITRHMHIATCRFSLVCLGAVQQLHTAWTTDDIIISMWCHKSNSFTHVHRHSLIATAWWSRVRLRRCCGLPISI